MNRFLCILAFLGTLITAESARAAYVLVLDTNAFVGSQATLSFELIDGTPGSTTVAFEGAKVDGLVTTLSGNLSDTSFYNVLTRTLVLGQLLELTFFESQTPNEQLGFLPDSFAIFLLNASNLPLFATSDPTGADSLLQWDVGGGAPLAFVGSLSLGVPDNTVPEPSSFILTLIALSMALWLTKLTGRNALGARLKNRWSGLGVTLATLVMLSPITVLAAPSLNGSTDLTASVQVTVTGLIYNRTTSTFDTTVTIRNTSASPLTKPFALAVLSLPPSVVLTNATAVADEGAPLIVLGGAALPPGSVVSVALKFVNSSNAAFPINFRLVQLIQPIPNGALIQGPDANGNGVRDDLEPLLNTRYATSPALRLPAVQVLSAMRKAIVSASTVESAFAAALVTNKALDCMVLKGGVSAGIKENEFLRDQMMNTKERVQAWLDFSNKLAGQSAPIGVAVPCDF